MATFGRLYLLYGKLGLMFDVYESGQSEAWARKVKELHDLVGITIIRLTHMRDGSERTKFALVPDEAPLPEHASHVCERLEQMFENLSTEAP